MIEQKTHFLGALPEVLTTPIVARNGPQVAVFYGHIQVTAYPAIR